MKTFKICPILLMLFIMGCSSGYFSRTPKKYQSKEDFSSYLMAGFSTEYPNLYCDEPIYSKKCRLRKLIDAMGYQDFYYSWPDKGGGDELWYIKQTSDREQTYKEVLVLSTTNPPQVKKMYNNMVYNDFGREIATTDKDQNNKKHIKFNYGSEIVIGGPYHLDTTGAYYCKGGRRYCCQESAFVEEPVLVYSIGSPENPV